MSFTHGLSGHPLFCIWKGIRRRCYSKSDKSYKYYGGRGITVCDEWRNDFKAFYDWCMANGWEKGLHVDKDIKPFKKGVSVVLYSPKTCSIVSAELNNKYKRKRSIAYIQFNSKNMTLFDWSIEIGVSKSAIARRLRKGLPKDQVLCPFKRSSNANPDKQPTKNQWNYKLEQ